MARVEKLHRGRGDAGAGFFEAGPFDFAAVFEALELRFDVLDFVVGKEGVLADAVFLPLAEHDVDGVVQDTARQAVAQLGHQDVGVAEIALGHRQRADMVVMTVGDGDGVQLLAVQQGIKGQGIAAVPFGVHAGIHQQAAIIQLDQPGAGADVGIGVQVRDTHGQTGRVTGSLWQKPAILPRTSALFRKKNNGRPSLCQAPSPRVSIKCLKKDLNITQKRASYIVASGKRLGGFLVFPSSYAPEVKGWLVWLLGGGRCNGVRPFFGPCPAGGDVSLLIRAHALIAALRGGAAPNNASRAC